MNVLFTTTFLLILIGCISSIQVPSPTPLTPTTQPPNYIWGIFGNFSGLFNITQYDITSGDTMNYPIPEIVGIPYYILSVQDSIVTLVSVDQVSMSIYAIDTYNLSYQCTHTIAMNFVGITLNQNSFGFNNQTNVLYGVGVVDSTDYDNENATIFSWDFSAQQFNIIPIQNEYVEGDTMVSGVYDYQNNIYYVNLFDSKDNYAILYAYNTDKTEPFNTPYVIKNDNSLFEIEFLLMTPNNQYLYGVTSDDDGFIMLYRVDYENGQVDLVYHTLETLITTAYPATQGFNEYIVLISHPSNHLNGNSVTIFNTINQQAKSFEISTLPEEGGFFIATL